MCAGTNTSRATQCVSSIPNHSHLVQIGKIAQVQPGIGTVQGSFAIFHGHRPIVPKRCQRTTRFTPLNNPFNSSSIKLLACIKFYITAGTLASRVICNIIFQFCKSFFSKVLKLLAFQGIWMFLCSQFPLFFPLPEKNKGKSYCTLSSSFAASRLASLLACAYPSTA